jgi:hypothetical protein
LLREVSRQKSSKRSSQYAFDAGDDDEFIPEEGPSKRRRASTGAAGSKDPASNSAGKIAKRSTYTPVSDDEEDLTLRQLSDSRRKAAAATINGNRSTAIPASARVTESQRASPKTQQPQPYDFQKAVINIRAHVTSQEDINGLPVICSNATLQKYMKGLEDAASDNNAYVFRNMRNAIDEELVKIGLPALPDT